MLNYYVHNIVNNESEIEVLYYGNHWYYFLFKVILWIIQKQKNAVLINRTISNVIIYEMNRIEAYKRKDIIKIYLVLFT